MFRGVLALFDFFSELNSTESTEFVEYYFQSFSELL